MSNPTERDTIRGTASSSSAELYLARRQGNLRRGSDGFRSPTLGVDPRRPLEGGRTPDPHAFPYTLPPRPPETNIKRNTPRTWGFFRANIPGAPRVNFPDRERTRGHLQSSGEAWGNFGERPRECLTPATDGHNAPPSHAMGYNVVGSASSVPVTWKPGRDVTIRGRKPGASTAE